MIPFATKLAVLRSGLRRHCCFYVQNHLLMKLHFSGVTSTSKDGIARASVNHFETLGIDRTFNVSLDELKSTYKNLMKDIHPDRITSLSEEDKAYKTSLASKVTRAYSVIRNPLSRALHMLDLFGASIDESDSSIISRNLLLEVMEMSELVENASSDEELKSLLKLCREKQSTLLRQLEVAFSNEDVKNARYLTAKLQYWQRIEDNINEKITSAD